MDLSAGRVDLVSYNRSGVKAGDIVGSANNLLLCRKLAHDHHRTKDLLSIDCHVIRGVFKHHRGNKVALLARFRLATKQEHSRPPSLV